MLARPFPSRRRVAGAFSLVEVLIVFVILGLLAAMTIPRLGRADTASREQVLAQRLGVLRLAIEMYREDHGVYPGRPGAALNGAADEAAFVQQLAGLRPGEPALARGATVGQSSLPASDEGVGRASLPAGEERVGQASLPASSVARIYLRDGVPRNPFIEGAAADRVYVITGAESPRFRGDAPAGWIYNADTGFIAANSDALDANGRRFDQY
jgi:type II secretory pathway pseudopilin PulG